MTKGQAKLIVTQKIAKELYLNYPNLAREIKEIKANNSEAVVIFQNGSSIEAVTSTDSSRGFRGNILVLDEFRLIKEDNLKRILRPFLNVNRQPPYLRKEEYKHLIEENKEIYISSAWYKHEWIWDRFKSFTSSMIKGRNYFVCALPYQLSVHHGLLSKQRVQEMMSEEDFDPIAWQMEMECLFFGESEKAFFKLKDIEKNRKLVKPFYPMDHLEFIKNKDKRKKSTKQNGEIRIISVDVAMMAGDENDATAFTLIRIIPHRDSYIRKVVYIETMNGTHSELQAIRLKQLFHDFEADYVVMDTQGAGISLYDDCTKVLYDKDRDVEYPAWTAINNEEMAKRALDDNALPVIYSLKVARMELNHEIAMELKSALEKGKLELLVNEIEGKEYLIEKHNFMSKSPEEQAELLKPYVQTTALVNEMVNLEYEMRNGYVKVKEVGRNRKDRYSSLAYGNYYAKLIEQDLLRDKNNNNQAVDFLLIN